MSYLTEFDGKSFVDVARGDLDLGTLDSEEDKKAQEEVAKSKEGLASRIKAALGDDVAEVRVSHRLTDSPPSWPSARATWACRCVSCSKPAARPCRKPSRCSNSTPRTR